MKYKCIIFDCDGILVDSEAISAKVFQEMLMELDYHLDFDVIKEQITGTSMKENLFFFENKINRKLPPEFVSEFRKRSFTAYQRELKPIEGVHSLLNNVPVPICTASSGPQKKIRLNLKITHLLDKFGDNIFSSYDIESWKPEPDIYLYAAKQMGFDRKDCLVIEDSEPGVIAAIKGGFDVYVLTDLKRKVTFENLGATVFFHMNELPQKLGF